ncbi:MAG: DUF1385 domain-containing protein [Anaerolineae bacterium]
MTNQNEFNYGGQAVIEGVMMRGSKALAVAVRNPAGEIVVHSEPLNTRIYGGRLARMPFLRGLTLLWDALGLGIKSLMFSAEVALEEESDDEEPAQVFEGPAQWGTVLFSLTFSVLLFFVLPTFLARQVVIWLGAGESQLAENFIEGVIRLGLLVGYVWGIGFIPDIRRLYGYHGAEHKTINAYEAQAELIPATVAEYPLEHPRCGTAFLLSVVVLSILIYSLLPPLSLLVRILSRIVLLPVVAGVAYEFIRYTAAHQDNSFIRLITKPNLALQRLTTQEPDEDMLAVAIAAFKQVMAFEQGQLELVETAQIIKSPLGEAAQL